MNSFGAISYSVCAFAFLLLFMLLVSSWRGRLQGAILVAAVAGTLLWSALQAYQLARGIDYPQRVLVTEALRDGLWLLFLIRLLSSRFQLVSKLLAYAVAAWTAMVIYAVVQTRADYMQLSWIVSMGFIGFSVMGLVVVEQLFRNTLVEQRWAIKFLCLGVVGFFVFDFYLYGSGLLNAQLNPDLWHARGLINAFCAPLLMLAAARNPSWSLDVFVSRRIAFHSTVLLAACSYLFLVVFIGYGMRDLAGELGDSLQAVFLFVSGLVFVAIAMSGQLRARIKVFLNKNFYNYKYDYRDEWLRLTTVLSAAHSDADLKRLGIEAIAGIVESPAGALWQLNETGRYVQTETWNLNCAAVECGDEDSLIQFLKHRAWVIDLIEYAADPERYDELQLPEWITANTALWLIVPLNIGEQLQGFLMLTRSRAPQDLNWEDTDILKTAGRQFASNLAQQDAARALSETRQFETYSRVTAFLMHDLKNIFSQISLVSQNAVKHKHKPEFINDAFSTIDEAVARMQRLLRQLNPAVHREMSDSLSLLTVLQQVVAERKLIKPKPVLLATSEDLHVLADKDRLLAVFINLVQNAQEASAEDGAVSIVLREMNDSALIEIKDNGQGMSAEFIRNQLFRPFTTTKGELGMGIGACDARDYIHKLGGRISVDSQVGQGSVFRIWLPIVRDDVDKVA